jgi:sugar/nucleoside kinase (ribokinase family)
MPERRFDLLVVGELNVDLLLYGDVTPVFGQVEKLVDDAALTVGGSSTIFAHGAAKLGLRVAFAGKVGADAFGEFMVGSLREAGIDTTGVISDPSLKTGMTIHLVRGDDRAMLTHPGSISELRAEDVDEDLLHSARHVHAGSYYLQEKLQPGLPALFAAARDAGATTSLDPGWDPAEDWDYGLRDVLRNTDFFLPNEQELLEITGAEDLGGAPDRLPEAATLVVKRGADGAVAFTGGRRFDCAPRPVEPVDTTGAGDSFDAGFVYGMLQGYGLDRSLRLGCLCGTLSTQGAGGVESQPDVDEVLAFEKREDEG